MLLAFGIVAALYERERSGQGQVIDAAIVDGTSSLMTMFAGLLPGGGISLKRDRNMLGGAAPFYRCYRCADGREIAVGAIEPHFYAQLIAAIDAPRDLITRQGDQTSWEADAAALAAIFAGRPASEWAQLLEGTDCCAGPVIELEDAPEHPHFRSRGVYVEHDGATQAAPVPRFSRTPGAIQAARNPAAMLAEWQRANG